MLKKPTITVGDSDDDESCDKADDRSGDECEEGDESGSARRLFNANSAKASSRFSNICLVILVPTSQCRHDLILEKQ